MKIKFLAFAVAALISIEARDALAILNIYVNANPFITPGYDINTTTTGEVDYRVYHEPNSTEGLIQFGLKFDKNVFKSFSLLSAQSGATDVFANFGVLDLGDSWLFTSTLLSPPLSPGSSMLLRVSYELYGGASTLYWPDGDGIASWSQSFVGASTTLGAPYNIGHTDGGSTSLAPEPGSMILLGTGLLGMGLVKRYRQRRNARS